MTGIDISGVQQDDVPGPWEFIVPKSTEGNSVVNPRVDAQWRNAARTTRGLYHYGRPAISSGVAQATVFVNDALARGFKPNVDLWQLDAEDGLNAGVTDWRTFIEDFMQFTLAHLGRRGFLYAGWPFLQEHGLADLPFRYMWWLPAYGPNTSAADNGIAFLPSLMQGLVVIHQFTSFGGLDQNKILNKFAYGAWPIVTPKPGGIVQQQFHPSLPPFVSSLVRSEGAWGLSADGGVSTLAGPFQGSMVGDPNFAGRTGARIVRPGAIVPGANPPFAAYPHDQLYEIIAGSGERYVPKRP